MMTACSLRDRPDGCYHRFRAANCSGVGMQNASLLASYQDEAIRVRGWPVEQGIRHSTSVESSVYPFYIALPEPW